MTTDLSVLRALGALTAICLVSRSPMRRLCAPIPAQLASWVAPPHETLMFLHAPQKNIVRCGMQSRRAAACTVEDRIRSDDPDASELRSAKGFELI